MGRLITPVPKKPRPTSAPVPSPPEIVGATAPKPEETGAKDKKETSAEQILKYIPAEVVAFYVAALGMMDSLDGKPGVKTAYWVVLVLGLIAAPLYILKLGKWKKTWRWQAIWAAIAFLVWAYTLGGAFKQIASFHQPWLGSLLLLAVTLAAGLFPPPEKENG